MIDFRDLVKAGVHFGHQSSRWCPRMAPYIWGEKGGIHLINVAKTAVHLEKAAKFLEDTIAEGKTVMWLGTKKPAQSIVTEAGKAVGMPFVTHRWIGGTLTNNSQVRKSVTKYLHLKDVIAKADRTRYTKKEFSVFQKMVSRLEKNIGGIVNMAWPVGAIVAVDVRKEQSAIKEAAMLGIPVIALVDTNCDPLGIDYVIPANDDSPKAIKLVIDYLQEAALRGKAVADAKKAEVEKEQELLREKKKAERKAAEVKVAEAKAAAETKKTEIKTTKVEAVQAAPAAEKKAEVKPAPKKAAAPKAAPKK
jgi:small subunit ribosomal protein S2